MRKWECGMRKYKAKGRRLCAILFLRRGAVEAFLKKYTSNIERPTSNVEWEERKKKTYDLEQRLLEYPVRIKKNDILEETRELIKIIVTSIKKELKLRSGATSLFDVQRWTFDVRCLRLFEVHLYK